MLTLTGRSQATPLTAWLRVPLNWVSSATIAQFPDETHTSIRRIFTPQEQPHCKRIFCGYCGTHLSYWTEEPSSEADFLSVTLGSLLGEDIRALKDLDLLPEDVEADNLGVSSSSHEPAVATKQQDQPVIRRSQRQGRLGNLDWFEEMIDGSKLGRTHTTRRGMGTSSNGNTNIQWEVTEYHDDGTEVTTLSGNNKRKIEDVAGDDVQMKG